MDNPHPTRGSVRTPDRICNHGVESRRTRGKPSRNRQETSADWSPGQGATDTNRCPKVPILI